MKPENRRRVLRGDLNLGRNGAQEEDRPRRGRYVPAHPRFPLYTVREFYTNARAQILCKQTGKSAMVDIPNGFPAFAQIGDLLICATVEDDLVAFQVMDQQGNLRFIEGNAGDGLELKCFAGIRDQRYTAFLPAKTTTCNGFSVPLLWMKTRWNGRKFRSITIWYGIPQPRPSFRMASSSRSTMANGISCISRLLKWGGTHANFLSSVPNGYHQFLDPRDEKSIRAILWDGVSDCASLVTYTPTCGAR